MLKAISKYSDNIISVVIATIVILTLAVGIAVVYNTAVTADTQAKTRETQVYTRFNSCAIAQRSYKGTAVITRQDLEYCWDRAEREVGYKVTRYYGESL